MRRPIDYVYEALGGVYGGVFLTAPGLCAFAWSEEFETYQPGWYLVARLGNAIGAAGGVAVAGTGLGQRGSFWLAMVGALIGVLVTSVQSPYSLERTVRDFAFFILPPLLATAGYNLRRVGERTNDQEAE